jgi:hypothetical protein
MRRLCRNGYPSRQRIAPFPSIEVSVEPSQLSWIVNFIWGIADDVLRDL